MSIEMRVHDHGRAMASKRLNDRVFARLRTSATTAAAASLALAAVIIAPSATALPGFDVQCPDSISSSLCDVLDVNGPGSGLGSIAGDRLACTPGYVGPPIWTGTAHIPTRGVWAERTAYETEINWGGVSWTYAVYFYNLEAWPGGPCVLIVLTENNSSSMLEGSSWEATLVTLFL